MHPAWFVEDIRLLIFELLEPGDLARLARTNKTLFDIATDHLWATIRSPLPFVCCLPSQCRIRELQFEDTERLDFYARKVKILILEGKGIGDSIDLPPPFPKRRPHLSFSTRDSKFRDSVGKSWEEVWTEVAQRRPNTLFLPNLVRLHVHHVVGDVLLPLVGITGSRLTYIYIECADQRQPESAVRRLLDRLRDTSKLEYLYVHDDVPDLVPPRIIEHSPLRYLHLHPRVDSFSHEGHQSLQFPLRKEILEKSTLEHLTLGLTRQWNSLSVQNNGHRYLPTLKILRLYLTTFRANDCHSCVNADADSWTCHTVNDDENQADRGIKNEIVKDCGRRSLSLFFHGLDNPNLDELRIIFDYHVSGKMILEVVQAASDSCRLKDLSDLSLLSNTWHNNCKMCGPRPAPRATPEYMKAAMTLLLPMNNLRILRLGVVPNFLKDLDLKFYRSMADGLPHLQTLWLGKSDFVARWTVEDTRVTRVYERVPLHHLAAFCHMVPSLVDVQVGTLDATISVEEKPRADWACPNIQTLSIWRWIPVSEDGSHVHIDQKQLRVCLKMYFPAVFHRTGWRRFSKWHFYDYG